MTVKIFPWYLISDFFRLIMADRNKNLDSQNFPKDKNLDRNIEQAQQNLGQQGQGLNKDVNKNIPLQTGEHLKQPGQQGQMGQTGQQGQQGSDQQRKY